MAVVEKGLSAVFCDDCDERPAQSYCKTCDGNLCKSCTIKHKNKKIFFRHDVVEMSLTRKMEKNEYEYCREHPEGRYILCCQECIVPVCLKCLVDLHNGHKMIDISTAYIEALRKITSKVDEIESSHFPECNKHLNDIDNILDDIDRQTNDVVHVVLSRSKELVDVVHAIEEDILKKISEEKEDIIKVIESYKKEDSVHLSTLISFYNNLIKEKDSKSMTNIILFSKKNLDIPQRKTGIYFKPSSIDVTKQFSTEIKDFFCMYFPSTILIQGRKQILKSAKEVAKFKSAIQQPIGLACSPPNVDHTWIRGEEAEIKKIDIQGNEKSTVKTLTKLGRPSGLIELDDGRILFSDIENKKMTILSNDLQEEADIRIDWYPMGLCISRSCHILVCAAFQPGNPTYASNRGKVLRMSYKGVTLQEIMKDNEGKPL